MTAKGKHDLPGTQPWGVIFPSPHVENLTPSTQAGEDKLGGSSHSDIFHAFLAWLVAEEPVHSQEPGPALVNTLVVIYLLCLQAQLCCLPLLLPGGVFPWMPLVPPCPPKQASAIGFHNCYYRPLCHSPQKPPLC